MRTVLSYLAMALATLIYGTQVLVAAMLGIRPRPNGSLESTPGRFSRMVLRASGTTVIVNGERNVDPARPSVYVGNHVSWWDVFSAASVLPRYRFMAKKELRRIPIFGPAAALVAGVFIDRHNRKAAFGAYAEAVDALHAGINIVVFPEGTRGLSYALRPFKKGPFVLAIAAQAPIVPFIVHGTREVQAKESPRVHTGVAELTFLEPVPTVGMGYADRNRLMRTVWQRMAGELERRYGVRSDAESRAPEPSAA